MSGLGGKWSKPEQGLGWPKSGAGHALHWRAGRLACPHPIRGIQTHAAEVCSGLRSTAENSPHCPHLWSVPRPTGIPWTWTLCRVARIPGPNCFSPLFPVYAGNSQSFLPQSSPQRRLHCLAEASEPLWTPFGPFSAPSMFPALCRHSVKSTSQRI